MRLVYPNEEQNVLLCKWLAAKMGGGEDGRCLAVMNDDQLVGALRFFNYRHPNIEVEFYCEDYRWALNRRGVLEALAYPFLQLDCTRITALAERSNLTSRKMLKRLGFKEEGKLRKASKSGDVFVYGLLPDDLKIRLYEKPKAAASA